MNRSIIRTTGNDKVNSRLTVPSKSSDIRLVAETGEKPVTKRGGFRKMARDSKSTANPRPARRIKLNRSIFNNDSTAKPTFRVKTLSEIKTEKQAKQDDVKPVLLSTEESSSVVVENVSSSVCASSGSPIPARSVSSSSVSADTRTVIKRENTTRLLLPTIQLKRIEHYSRNFHKNISPQNARTFVNKDLGRGETLPKEPPRQAALTPSTEASPVKKRKVGSMRQTISNPQVNSPIASPLKKRKISPVRSPDAQPEPAIDKIPAQSTTSPLQAPSLLPENPPSPALSLRAQSADELSEMNIPVGNSRVIIMTESTTHSPKKPTNTNSHQYQNTKPVKTQNVHTRLGPPPNCKIQSTSFEPNTDDTLDVLTVVDDDDELFLEDKNLNGPLKRSISEDSIFSMADESNNRGNLRTLAKKTHDIPSSKHLVDDLITSKPVSKSFKIPRRSLRNSSESGSFPRVERSASQPSENDISSQTGGDPRNGFFGGHLSHHPPPKPTRVVSQDGWPLNGFSVEEKVRSIQRNLGCKNICEAWTIIKELDDRKSTFDVRVLEETVKVCGQISSEKATPGLAEIVLNVFNVLERRGVLKPMAYILTILTLSRCGNFQQAFDKLKEMIKSRTFPHQEILVHFVSDLNECLHPKWTIELLQYIKSFNFSNSTRVFNDCLSSLTAVPVETLREITTSQWDSLIAMVCVPPNTHAAVQVEKIMDKHCIPMSDQAITRLLILFRDTKCTKQLLDFAHKKCTDQTFDIGPIFDDRKLILCDVEAHISNLLKAGVLPRDDVFHNFIDKASSQKEFTMIYGLFIKSSSVKLSVTTLKKMVDALESWDENVNASVEVYSALRQARMAAKNDTLPTSVNRPLPASFAPKPLPAKSQYGVCFAFKDKGWCRFGDRCWYSHAVEGTSSLQSVALNGGKQQLNHNEKIRSQASIPATGANIPLINGVAHNAPQFPSFQPPSVVVPTFKQTPNPMLRIPQAIPSRHLNHVPHTSRFAGHNSQPFADPLPMTKPPSPTNQPPLPKNKPPAMTKPPPPTNHPPPLMVQPVSFPRETTTNTDKVKLNRSFSWEPRNNPPPKLRQSPLLPFHQPSPGSDNNNNNKMVSELQQRIQHGLTSKDWHAVYLCYVEMKTAKSKTIQASDLKIFRSVFVKDLLAVGSNFCEFVDFIHRETSSVKSSYSDSATPDAFDKYDVEFLGSLGVSLMEKCLVIKKHDKGYEILHCLHAHNISYFDCGKNFGAYIRDIPPSAVAIIAVKLCLGMSQEDGLLGAIEVLRASNYAMPERDTSPDNMEYRIKVLQQLFTQLLDEGNVSEAYEILQHLNASPHVLVPLFVKVLDHYSRLEDFDQSFDVLAEMKEKGLNLNIPACHSFYEKFLKLCLRNEQDEEAMATLKEMELRSIMLNGDVWQEMLNYDLIDRNEVLTKQLFLRCINLGVYPESFSTDTPWLCQLGCGYSRLEVRLLVVRHLKQLYQHLVVNAPGSLSLADIRDFQITLFPRVSESNTNQRFDEGIETAINRNGLIVAKVLLEDLNPPLTISDQTQEQFHSKFIVDARSLYRWFNANDTEEDDGHDDDASSKGSIETCMSFMTRMTEFD